MIHIYIIFISLLFSQRLITEVNEIDKLRFEYEAIESNKISDKLFFSPFIQDKPSDEVVSVGYKHFFQIEPTFAIRSSLKGFGMYNESYQSNTFFFDQSLDLIAVKCGTTERELHYRLCFNISYHFFLGILNFVFTLSIIDLKL